MEFSAEQAQKALDGLDNAFDWELSPQGWTYWETVYDNLEQMIRDHTTRKASEVNDDRPS